MAPKGSSRGAKSGRKKSKVKRKTHSKTNNYATSSGASHKIATEASKGHILKKSLLVTDSSNPNRPSMTTIVVAELHKEDPQSTSGQIYLGTIGEERVNPQLISVVSTSAPQPINTYSTIMHSNSKDRVDKSKSVVEELNPDHNNDSSSKDLFDKEQSNKEELKLDDIIKLMLLTMDERILGNCDSHEDKKPLIVSSDVEEEPKVTPTLDPGTHKDTEDTLVPTSPRPSPKS
nr:hypothetical protein [Tanacetum cinerariifolium]